MWRRSLLALIPAALLTAVAAPPLAAQVVSDQSRMVAKAASTVERISRDAEFGPRLANLLPRARAAFIVPDLLKAGLLLGAEYGTGVLLVRGEDGRWSGPAFYSVASGSLGLQLGIQDSETVYVIMTEGGLNAIKDNRFKMGADAGVALAHVGAGAEASTTTNGGADIYSLSKAVGAYGGASLEGAAILPRHSWNAAFYGGNPHPDDILVSRSLDTPQADRLRDLLGR